MPIRDLDQKRQYDRDYYAAHTDQRRAYERLRADRPERKEQRKTAGAKYRKKGYTPDQKARYAAKAREHRLANPPTEERRRLTKAKDRERKLIAKYGKTSAELVQMLADQGGVCKLCGTAKPGSRHGWHTDHCHETGLVRGILCRRCNTAIGHFEHDPEFLRKAARYVEDFAAGVAKQNV